MPNSIRTTERGSAQVKFVLVMAILIAAAYAGYLYVPVAYQANALKDAMQHNVDIAGAMARSPSWVQEQLVKNAPEYGLPADAVITPIQQNNRIEVRVQFTRPIEFPGYTYQYEFDHTAKSSTFFSP
jgi:hypothetical protein